MILVDIAEYPSLKCVPLSTPIVIGWKYLFSHSPDNKIYCQTFDFCQSDTWEMVNIIFVNISLDMRNTKYVLYVWGPFTLLFLVRFLFISFANFSIGWLVSFSEFLEVPYILVILVLCDRIHFSKFLIFLLCWYFLWCN